MDQQIQPDVFDTEKFCTIYFVPKLFDIFNKKYINSGALKTFKFIEIVPNHHNSCLKVLYNQSIDPTVFGIKSYNKAIHY